MDEIWKDIDEFKGCYQVSNLGNVRSLDRYYTSKSKTGKTYQKQIKGKTLKICAYPNGYNYVNLNIDGFHCTRLVHRLVAIAFLPNPNNLPEVNHKDENNKNNELSNLEWCTAQYNANYGTRNQRCFEHANRKQQKPINQLSLNGEIVKRWDGIGQASRELGISDSQIIKVCKHKNNQVTAGGYKWEYAD